MHPILHLQQYMSRQRTNAQVTLLYIPCALGAPAKLAMAAQGHHAAQQVHT